MSNAPPTVIKMPSRRYATLYGLTKWVDDTPACVDLPDRAWERIWEQQQDMVPRRGLDGFYVLHVGIADDGDLFAEVALEEDDDDTDRTWVVTLQPRQPRTKKSAGNPAGRVDEKETVA